MARRPWPNPNDTALDRARSIARGYREALRRANPTVCEVLDRAAREFGETWLLELPDPAADYLTRAEVAELAGVTPNRVSQWTRRGHLTRYPDGYRADEVRAFLSTRAMRYSARNTNKPDRQS